MEMGFIPVNISIPVHPAVPATEISNNWENGKQKFFYKAGKIKCSATKTETS